MITAVVPAQNEAGRIATVLHNLGILPIDYIIVITNGSTDATLPEVLTAGIPKLQVLYFHESLGIDVPRSIGAKTAAALGSDVVLFIDGDMVGTFHDNILELIDGILRRHLDLALTNCYPQQPRHIERCNPTFQWRLALNKELGLERKLNFATPSHGPHAVSKRFLQTIALRELAIPPVPLALARLHKLNIDIATTIPHYQLGSAIKNQLHRNSIIDTIVGDCLEAIAVFKNQPRTRMFQNKSYQGYNSSRRFDLLDSFLAP